MFIGALGAGGAERTLIVLAEGFQHRGHDVTVLTWINQEADFYTVPASVKHVRADIPKNVVSTRWYDVPGLIRRLYAVRKSIQRTQPDVVISFLDGNNEIFLLSSIAEKYRKILSCQIDIERHEHFNPRWNTLRNLIYRWADKIVFLDKEQASRASLKSPSWQCIGIPNPVMEIDTSPDEQAKIIIEKILEYPIRLVAMGRLENQKGFDLLLEAFKRINQNFSKAVLVILGEGQLRGDLQEQVKRLGLSENVFMPGQIQKPHSVIKICDIFVFSSRYEGQGLALVEAMACGVPAVSFDCPSGPSSIIRNHVDGVIVPPEDFMTLAKEANKLLDDKKTRLEYAGEARKVRDRYSTVKICSQWEELFSQLKN